MKDWRNVIKWFLSIASFLFSLAVLCKAFPRLIEIPNETGFDYIGVIIGVLSLLVTVLMGWNIYSVIDMKYMKKQIEEISVGAFSNLHKNMAISEQTNFMLYHYLLLRKDPLGLEYRLIYHGIASLYHTSMFGDINMCNVIVKGLLECIAHPDQIIIKENKKNEILLLVAGVKNANKIEQFSELVNKIALIRVK